LQNDFDLGIMKTKIECRKMRPFATDGDYDVLWQHWIGERGMPEDMAIADGDKGGISF
jgi:hypothetical protein